MNGIKLNCWCGPVTFNFLNLRECEGLDSEVACWHELGPRGVDYISRPGEKEGNLGGNLFSFFVPCIPTSLVLSLLLFQHEVVLKGQQMALRQCEAYSALVAQINILTEVK